MNDNFLVNVLYMTRLIREPPFHALRGLILKNPLLVLSCSYTLYKKTKFKVFILGSLGFALIYQSATLSFFLIK